MDSAAPALEVTHKFATVNGIRMHYVEAGTGPLVVLLHGFPESWYCWRHQIAELAKDHRVVAPDQRGYNETQRRGPYDIDTLQRDVIGLIDACGERSAHIIGHDWGGAVAWALGLFYPEVVDSLVVCNLPHPAIFRRAIRRNPRQMLRSWYFLFFQLPWLPEQLLGAFQYRRLLAGIVDQCVDGAFTEADQKVMLAQWRRSGVGGGIDWYRAALRHPPRLPKPLPTVAAPTTLIWGDGDRFLGKELTEGTGELVRDFHMRMLSEVSHWVQEEAPDEVNFLLREHFHWVDELRAGAGARS